MIVSTFFAELPEVDIKEQEAMIAVWRRSWERYGWTPRILTRVDSMEVCRPAYDLIMHSPELARGALPKGYAQACHVRWLAHMKEGGLMVDYDVLNQGFTPWNMQWSMDNDYDNRPMMLMGAPCPAAVWASPQDCQAMLSIIVTQAILCEQSVGELATVCHDQAIFAANPNAFKFVDDPICQNYRHEKDNAAKLIHFANCCTPQPRSAAMAAFIK